MTERATVTEVTQIGAETVPGTLVATTKKLRAASISLNVDASMDTFTPEGIKFPTLTTELTEMASGDIEGRGTFNEMLYLLNGAIKSVSAGAQILDTAIPTGMYPWTFVPASDTEDTVKTFTVERGGAYRANRAGYVVINELGLSFKRDGAVELSGSVFGKAIEDGITLTAGNTELTPVPIAITGVDVYMDATSGALGTTKLARLKSADLKVGPRFNPLWVIDSSQSSYVAHVEGEFPLTFDVTLEADAQGMGVLPLLRAGTTRFVRLKATGPAGYVGGVTVNHSLIWDMCLKVTDPGDFDDDDGLRTIDWGFKAHHDATWGKAMSLVVTTNVATL